MSDKIIQHAIARVQLKTQGILRMQGMLAPFEETALHDVRMHRK